MSEAAVIPRHKLNESRPIGGFGADHRRRSRDPRVAADSAGMEGYEVRDGGHRRRGPDRGSATASYDLVLLDLALPDRNGMEILAELHTQDSAAVGHHDHRLRHRGERGEGHAVGRRELRPEAVGQRKAAGRRSRRGGPASSGRRERPAQARAETALQLRKHRGQERAHAEDFRPGRAGGAQPLDHLVAGRKRDRQRS